MNQFIDENCNSSVVNSFLKMNQFICFSQINPNELNANSFMNGNGPCTTYQDMCASIGVDPLASSKGFWSEMLGVGDFYYELGVQIVEVCMASSHREANNL